MITFLPLLTYADEDNSNLVTLTFAHTTGVNNASTNGNYSASTTLALQFVLNTPTLLYLKFLNQNVYQNNVNINNVRDSNMQILQVEDNQYLTVGW